MVAVINKMAVELYGALVFDIHILAGIILAAVGGEGHLYGVFIVDGSFVMTGVYVGFRLVFLLLSFAQTGFAQAFTMVVISSLSLSESVASVSDSVVSDSCADSTRFEPSCVRGERQSQAPNIITAMAPSGRHDVQSLSVQFGKSEAYIRTRLKFSALIPEIAALLDADEITVSVATEICRYSEDIQREVYDTHFENDNYSSWRGLKASEVARNIERDYTTNLRNYKFDKSACANCPHNTCNLLLFVEDGDEGKCANRPCLAEKNCAHLLMVQKIENQRNIDIEGVQIGNRPTCSPSVHRD